MGVAKDAQEHRERDGGIPKEDDPSDDEPGPFKKRSQLGRREPERLKETGNTVTQVHGQESHSKKVESTDKGIGESGNHHAVDIMSTLGVNPCPGHRIESLPGELRQMEDNKSNHHQTREAHRTCVDGGLQRIGHRVFLRGGGAIFHPELDRAGDVKPDDCQQNEAYNPEERAEGLKMLSIRIDPIRAGIDRQVAEQMPDDEEDQKDARDRNDPFATDGGRKQGAAASATGTAFAGGFGRK